MAPALATFVGVTLVAVAIAALPGYLAALCLPDGKRVRRFLIESLSETDRSGSYACGVPLQVVETRAPRPRELAVLLTMAARFWMLRGSSRTRGAERVERAAAAIPDPRLRAQALATLRNERLSAAGAALFATTITRHVPVLVRTLVAYQVICDYLDTLSEQPAADPAANGMLLHRALADATRAGERHGRLVPPPRLEQTTAATSRRSSAPAARAARLCPPFSRVRAAARREAGRNEVQGIKDGPAGWREPQLRAWADAQARGEEVGDATWFELAAAGSSPLAALALLAAAADPATSAATAEQTRRCYFPWIEALSTLLDSLADRERDAGDRRAELRRPIPVRRHSDRAPPGAHGARARERASAAQRRPARRTRRRHGRDAPVRSVRLAAGRPRHHACRAADLARRRDAAAVPAAERLAARRAAPCGRAVVRRRCRRGGGQADRAADARAAQAAVAVRVLARGTAGGSPRRSRTSPGAARSRS